MRGDRTKGTPEGALPPYLSGRYTRDTVRRLHRPEHVTMTQPNDSGAPAAYTRGSVMAYLKVAEAERQRLRQAILEARARTASARRRIERLDALGLGTSAPLDPGPVIGHD